MAVERDGNAAVAVFDVPFHNAVPVSDDNNDLIDRNGLKCIDFVQKHRFVADVNERSGDSSAVRLSGGKNDCGSFHVCTPRWNVG